MSARLRHIVLLVILAMTVYAQDATFTASVDPSVVAAGEQFQVTFQFTGSGASNPSDLKAPDFGQFVVISGPNTSQSFQFVNGRSSIGITYTYVLYARQPGTFTIGPASLTYKGQTVSTQPVKVSVEKGKPKQQQQSTDGAGTAASIGDNIVLKAIVDRSRVRMGEQVTVTWKIYTRVGMSISRISKLPTYEGFWGEDFDLPKQPELVTETLNGKQYRAAILKKTALFPSQTGTLKVGPMELVAAVQVQSRSKSRDPFDQFFNDPFFQSFQTVEVEYASNPLAITVDPLPAGAPEGFGNAVGTFQFSAGIDRREVKAGDAVTLSVKVTGSGNIKLVTMPKPTVPGDIEMFDPKLDENIVREGGSVRGTKSADYVLVPRNEGKRTIPAMIFSYYDPTKRSYVTLTSPTFALSVLPGRELATSAAGLSKEDVRVLGEDIRFIKLQPGSWISVADIGTVRWMDLFVLVVPPLACIGAYGMRRRRERIYGDLPSLRFQRAGREAGKRLKVARQLLAQGNSEQYHAEVLRALTGYLEHKLRIPKASLSTAEVLSRLAEQGVPEDTITGVRSCLERAEFARYAPGGDSRASRQDLITACTTAIDDIERTFKA